MTDSTLYALLIGINDYRNKKFDLTGCVDDVFLVRDYLLKYHQELNPQIEILTDSNAKYQDIIDVFRSHLTRAKPNDYVLFYYSGHGMWQSSAPEFRRFYPSHYDESMVCYDSLRNDVYSLADKEMAVLLSEVQTRQAVVILDCCHSGSGSRDWSSNSIGMGGRYKVRRIPRQSNERPLQSYLNGYFIKQTDNLNIPPAHHMLLAACKRFQNAAEDMVNDPNAGTKTHGLFTWHLIKTLRESNGKIDYLNLFKLTRMSLIRATGRSQDPSFEPFGQFNIGQEFLGRVVSHTPGLYKVDYSPELGSFRINAGLLQGLVPDTRISISLAAGDKILGKVDNVYIDECSVSFEKHLPLDRQFDARIDSLLAHFIQIHISTEKGKEYMAAYIEKHMQQQNFKLVEVMDIPEHAYYRLHLATGGIEISDMVTERRLGTLPYFRGHLDRLLLILQQLYRWQRISGLQHPNPKIATDKIDVTFQAKLQGQWTTFDQSLVYLDWGEHQTGDNPIEYKITVKNNSRLHLQTVLLYLHELDPQVRRPARAHDVSLDPGAEAEILSHHIILKKGFFREVDRFKLILFTKDIDFDSSTITMPPLSNLFVPPKRTRSISKGALDDELETNSQEPDVTKVWFTKSLTIVTRVAPRDE